MPHHLRDSPPNYLASDACPFGRCRTGLDANRCQLARLLVCARFGCLRCRRHLGRPCILSFLGLLGLEHDFYDFLLRRTSRLTLDPAARPSPSASPASFASLVFRYPRTYVCGLEKFIEQTASFVGILTYRDRRLFDLGHGRLQPRDKPNKQRGHGYLESHPNPCHCIEQHEGARELLLPSCDNCRSCRHGRAGNQAQEYRTGGAEPRPPSSTNRVDYYLQQP